MKKLTAILLCLCLLLPLASCNGQTAPNGSTPDPASSTPESTSQDANTLTVYYLTTDTWATPYSTFRGAHPDVTVNAVAFDSAAEMEDQLINEMQTGTGPDVILFTDETTLDLTKLARHDAFAPLDDMMAADETYEAENYLPAAIKGCQVDGQQFFLPITLSLSNLYADKNAMADMGITTGYTLAEFFEKIAATASGKRRIFPGFSPVLTEQLPRVENILIQAGGYKFISEDGTLADITADGLKPLVDAIYTFKTDQGGEAWAQGDFFLQWLYSHDFVGDYWRRKDLNRIPMNDAVGLYTIPTFADKDALIATASWFGAVNTASQNKELAYTLIRTLMDKYPGDKGIRNPETPVRISLFDETVAIHKIRQTVSNDRTAGIRQLTDEEAAMLQEIFGKITAYVIPNPKTESILLDTFAPYFTGSADYDSCFAAFLNRLKVYAEE